MATVVTRGVSYCNDCFSNNILHKYKMMFGKSKILKPDERVLIAYSGGNNSRALVHICFLATGDQQHKRMRHYSMVCHIDERLLWGEVSQSYKRYRLLSSFKEIDWNMNLIITWVKSIMSIRFVVM
jgi:hypothetical protein